MPSPGPPDHDRTGRGVRLRIGPVELDPRRRQLRAAQRGVETERKVFDLLLYLAERPGQVVTKDELLVAVWHRNIASDSVIAQAVSKARRVLAELGADDAVATVHGVGYRLDAPVAYVNEDRGVAPSHAATGGRARWLAALAGALLGVAGTAWWLRAPDTAAPLVIVMSAQAGASDDADAWLRQSVHLVLGRRLERRGAGMVLGDRLARELQEPLDQGADLPTRIAAARRAAPYVVVPVIEAIPDGYAVHADVHAADGDFRISARGVDPIRVADEVGIQLAARLRPDDDAASARALSPEAFANQAYARGLVAIEEGRAGEARDLLAAAVSQDPGFVAAQYELAIAERESGRIDDALVSLARLAALAEQGNDRRLAARVANATAVAWFQRGELASAEQHWRAARAHYVAIEDRGGVATLDLALAIVATNRGHFDQAVASANGAMAYFREAGDRARVADVLNQFGVIAWRRYDVTASADFHRQALAIRRDIGLLRRAAASINNIATTAEYRGDWDGALRDYEQALSMRRALRDRPGEISTLLNVARLGIRSGRLSAARVALDSARPVIDEVGDRYRAALARRYEAEWQAASGELSRAPDEAIASADAMEALGYAADACETRVGAAMMLLEAGAVARAGELAAQIADAVPELAVAALAHQLAWLEARILEAHGDAAGAARGYQAVLDAIETPDLAALRAAIAADLGFLHLRGGDDDRAAGAAAQAMVGSPLPVESHLLMAAISNRHGDPASTAMQLAAARRRAGEAWRLRWAGLVDEFLPAAATATRTGAS